MAAIPSTRRPRQVQPEEAARSRVVALADQLRRHAVRGDQQHVGVQTLPRLERQRLQAHRGRARPVHAQHVQAIARADLLGNVGQVAAGNVRQRRERREDRPAAQQQLAIGLESAAPGVAFARARTRRRCPARSIRCSGPGWTPRRCRRAPRPRRRDSAGSPWSRAARPGMGTRRTGSAGSRRSTTAISSVAQVANSVRPSADSRTPWAAGHSARRWRTDIVAVSITTRLESALMPRQRDLVVVGDEQRAPVGRQGVVAGIGDPPAPGPPRARWRRPASARNRAGRPGRERHGGRYPMPATDRLRFTYTIPARRIGGNVVRAFQLDGVEAHDQPPGRRRASRDPAPTACRRRSWWSGSCRPATRSAPDRGRTGPRRTPGPHPGRRIRR